MAPSVPSLSRESFDAPGSRAPLVGLCAGLAIGLADFFLMLALGAEMVVAGFDAFIAIFSVFVLSYGGLGWLGGRLHAARAQARADAETIARQLRALESAQRELVQAEKLAAIGRVAAGIAHEVRNPLGVIRASASMVQESFDPEEDAYRACGFICEEIDRLNALIRALLGFARPTVPQREAVVLSKVAERALSLARSELEDRGVAASLTTDAAGAQPEAELDSDLVTQVVYDLLSNAAEAAGEGGRVEVRIGSTADSLFVEVADDGPGVSDEHAEQLFEPFFTTKASGTGLGLAMAERIADAHAGTLSLLRGRGAGPSGAGACFRLELPRGAGEPASLRGAA